MDYPAVFCKRKNEETNKTEFLLGLKKQGFSKGKYDGFGGKIEAGETLEQAARREIERECGIKCSSLELCGKIMANFQDSNQVMNVFVFQVWVPATDVIKETDEMTPFWFSEDNVPYSDMWPDFPHWVPTFLKDKKFIARYILFLFMILRSFLHHFVIYFISCLELTSKI